MIKVNSTSRFVEKSTIIHNNKFDYSLSNWKRNKEKIEIICPKHGSFWQTAANHLQGNGCRDCREDNRYLIRQQDTIQFIEKAKEVHGDLYDYSESIYEHGDKLIIIICPIHGKFEQKPRKHIEGCGCQKCGKISIITKLSNRRSQIKYVDFIKSSETIFDYKYDYSNVHDYKSMSEKVEIICPIHGKFLQRPATHIRGHGCLPCSHDKTGMGFRRTCFINKYKDKLCTLYMLQCWNDNEQFIKIGLTGRTIKERFYGKSMPYNFKIIKTIINEAGRIWDLERDMKIKNKHLRYKPLIPFGGQTECLSLDFLSTLSHGN